MDQIDGKGSPLDGGTDAADTEPHALPRAPGVSLATLRKGLGLTRSDVADTTGEGRGAVSELEEAGSFDALPIGALRRYVAGLGGSLELVVRLATGSRVAIVPSVTSMSDMILDEE